MRSILYTLESMWMIDALLYVFFPATCMGCGAQDTSLCKRCISLTRKSLSATHPYILSVFDFKDPLIRKAIHAIKYYHRKDLIWPLASSLASELEKVKDIGAYTLIPIPMPSLRKFFRGYNQAEGLAVELSHMLSLPVRSDILMRNKGTPRQVKAQTRETRLKNQRGSFVATADTKGMRLLLVDDVTTTGATLEEARKTLMRQGAQSVMAITIAH